MKIINEAVSFRSLWEEKQVDLGEILKIVVDVKQQAIGVDAEMHADIEEVMLEQGSKQSDLWGANLLDNNDGTYEIEYTSFINIRPGQGNRAMEVQSEEVRRKMEEIIRKRIL